MRLPNLLAAAMFAVFPQSGLAAIYEFTKMVDTTGPFANIWAPCLNSEGTVAFHAQLDSGTHGIFTAGAGGVTTIKTAPSHLIQYYPSINSAGMVPFGRTLPTGERELYLGDGSFTITILNSTEYEPFTQIRYPDVNDTGTVAFWGTLEGREGIFTSSGEGTLTTVVDNSGAFGPLSKLTPPSINNRGEIAFGAELDTGQMGIFVASGGQIDTVAVIPPGGIYLGHKHASINDAGSVAFVLHQGVFTATGGSVTTIADTSGAFSMFHHIVNVNNTGTVQFVAALKNYGLGVFTGPDPIRDKVIATGDPLFGDTVATVTARGLNDSGQVAFLYRLENGSSGIGLATVVPEPASLAIWSMGVFAMAVGFVRRRRHRAWRRGPNPTRPRPGA